MGNLKFTVAVIHQVLHHLKFIQELNEDERKKKDSKENMPSFKKGSPKLPCSSTVIPLALYNQSNNIVLFVNGHKSKT